MRRTAFPLETNIVSQLIGCDSTTGEADRPDKPRGRLVGLRIRNEFLGTGDCASLGQFSLTAALIRDVN